MTVAIRSFTMEDLPAVERLWDAAEDMAPPPRAEVERKLERDAHLFLVAEEDDRIVGVVMGTFDGRRGWIFRLAVDHEHRRDGVGRQLIEELERRFVAMDVRHIRLLTLSENTGGRSFWRAAGYDEFDEVVMFSKDITADGADRC